METTRKSVGELLEAVPRQAKIKRSEYQESGNYPIVDQSQADVSGYTDDEIWLYRGELPVVIFGDHTRLLKFVDFPFCVGADGTQLLRPIKGNDIRYFYYALRNIDLTNYGYERHFKYLKEERIPVPPLRVQQRIAHILSAYDELIENSLRRIRILEAMARALYREWFVHFRFPGHEQFKHVSSSFGTGPQGWEICALGDFVQFKSGFAFKSGTFTTEGEHRLVTIKNVQDGSFDPKSDSLINELPENLPTHCTLQDCDILLSLTGNVGRVCLVYDGPFLLNQRVAKLVPVDNFDWAMTYCVFRDPEMRAKLEQLSNGVAQQNLSPVLASKTEFVRPPRELRQRFAAFAEPMVRRIVQLYSTSQNLRRTRDLLLPRLLSGQFPR